MNIKNDNFKVGLLIITAIIIFLSIIFFVGKISDKFRPKYKLVILFSNIDGLKKGSPARISGLKAGIVKDIKLKDLLVQVELQIDSNIKIRKDAEFYIGTSGLMGEKFVEIVNGTKKFGFLKDKDKIRGKDPLLLSKLFNESRDMILALRNTIISLNSLVDKKNKGSFINNISDSSLNLKQTLKNINDVTSKLNLNSDSIINSINNTVRELKDIIRNNKRNIQTTLKNLNNLSDRFNIIVNSENRDKVAQILKNISITTAKLKKIINEFEKNGETVNNIRNAIKDFRSSAKTVKDVSKEVKEMISENKPKIEKGIDSVNKINDSLENVLGKDIKFYYSLRYSSENHDYHSDLSFNVLMNEKKSVWAGVDDIGSDNQFNIQIHRNKRKITKKIGIFSSKVGVGIDYNFRKRFLYSFDLIDTVSPFIDIIGYYKINSDFSLKIKLNDVFDEKNINVSLRQQF